MRNRFGNKLIAILLMGAMCFTFTACGSGGSGGAGNNPAPEDIQWEDDGASYIAEYDFGLELTADGSMLSTLDKMDYTDLGSQKESFQKKVEEGIEAAGLGKYELITEFEEMEESMEEAIENEFEMGDILYSSGTEEDDFDLGVLEVAAYQRPMDGKYYQYIIYNTKSYYGSEAVDAQEIVDLLGSALGVKVDPEIIKAAAAIVEEKALSQETEEGEDGDDDGEEVIEDGEVEDEDVELEDGELEDSDDEIVLDQDDLEDGDIEIGEDAEEGSESAEEGSEDVESEGEKVGDDTDEELELGESDEGIVVEEGDEDSEDGTIELEEGEDGEFVDEDGNPISLDDLDFEWGDEEGGEYYPCFMKQEAEFKGDGYTDNCTFYLIGENVGDGSIVIYAAVERYRCYDEQ